MRIGNMPEDELDELFRKAASGYNPEYDPEAWAAMAKKLDAPPAPRAFKGWRFSGLLVLLFLISTGLWVGYNRSAQNLPGAQVKPTEITTEIKAKPKPTAGADNNPVEPGTEHLPNQPAGQGKSVGTGPGKTLAPTLVTVAPADKGAANPGREVGQPIVIAGRESNRPPAENKSNSAGLVGADKRRKGNMADTVLTDAQPSGWNLPVADSGQQVTVAAKPAIAPDTSLAPASRLAADSLGKAAAKGAKPKLSLNRLTLGLVAAPDLTAVGIANLGGISTNAGILVSYKVAAKWQVTTGIISARKVYKATPDDYGNEYEFWQNRRKPDDIAAVCQVLDIPVNIGYQVWQKGQNSFMVNTGLSSYLMRREKYTYEYYAYGGNNGYSKDWQIRNQNKHLFSIYNLSVGYGRQLGRGLQLGVEPFFKMPLAGVGAGKIKLTSTGIFFSLSYRYTQ